MPPVGFEPTISAGERPQTYALDRAATGTGFYVINLIHNHTSLKISLHEGPHYHLEVNFVVDNTRAAR